ncbi:acetyl-CoA carboxylase biotin carboxyl carrier protein [Capnocytophaga canimorsus]|uniref:Biotin carboxyl carrier protein of acetyl-CoA carboxylase n=1 Tax=Capnocytophaga canimorsus TaxID=28188 RepID=A0A0B7HEG1_9FLAO|nr:acetyl-CoA carboxylase biotin carboxyl carrier protein [Capnocytophaga canimorsus]ATA77522.1 acetyl-CoA carboxylase, biotin carboxyl carrier protein [Capnocytophaga canimorsus]PJI82502.1 acetyl-CoA carboxylase biotin carboxyl carrier protein [Capnocytophaga canimorsus]CEN35973.1 Biotin carboxyl carrier protein of acetyl-CoA carboxylase [Capnocytophaga canimorsus]CEN51158.1 Biotin carboxyl carrier protein of acetyl-CoA carboxylase [Capnocytophaga canimorsus]STA72791.1 Biotin carboxyl carrier
MDLKDIQNLIKFVAKSGASEVKLEMEDIKITIKTNSEEGNKEQVYVQQLPIAQPMAQIPVQQPVQLPTTAPETQSTNQGNTDDSKYVTIKSPMIGTFYRRPAPDKPLFVEVGSTIAKGDVLCIVEAMKLFNEIESEVSGKIVKILVDDSSPVEFDQPLFLVDPS